MYKHSRGALEPQRHQGTSQVYCRRGGDSSYNLLSISSQIDLILQSCQKLRTAVKLILFPSFLTIVILFRALSHPRSFSLRPVFTFILCKNSKCISLQHLFVPPSFWEWQVQALCLDRQPITAETSQEEHAPSQHIHFHLVFSELLCPIQIGIHQQTVEHVSRSPAHQETALLPWYESHRPERTNANTYRSSMNAQAVDQTTSTFSLTLLPLSQTPLPVSLM